MLTSHTRLIAAAFAGSLGLAACGGGGSPSSIAPPAQSHAEGIRNRKRPLQNAPARRPAYSVAASSIGPEP